LKKEIKIICFVFLETASWKVISDAA